MKRFLILFLALICSPALAGNLHDIVTKDSTDRSVTVYIFDSTDGTPETAVAYGDAALVTWYRREGGLKITVV